MMNHYLLRRKYRIVTLVLVTGAIYLCFQLFSFKVLDFSHHSMNYDKKRGGILLEDVKDVNLNTDNGPHYRDGLKVEGAHNVRKKPPSRDGADLEKGNNNLIFERNDKIQDLQDSEAVRGNVLESEVKLQQHNSYNNKSEAEQIRGTHIAQMEAYRPRENRMFQCLQSKELVPYSAVNDDYCDCSDSSDEPGTSACPHSQFYCTFQYKDAAPQFITGSRVGDGVCDCCDGSDEWQGNHVFQGVHLTGKRWSGTLTHAPCENNCAAVERANEDDEKIRQMGKRLKVAYIQAGKAERHNDMYGPDNVFYRLSTACFDIKESEYTYTLCPFKSVTQQKFPAPATNIGKLPNWQVKSHGTYILKMEKGDLKGCPGGKHRSTVITFICGLSDKVLKLAETEKCTYSMTFTTPAAC